MTFFLLAPPLALRTQLQMQIAEGTKYEQLKSKIMPQKCVTARWDLANSLQISTRTANDDTVPMEVGMVTEGKKGKANNKGKTKSKGKGQMIAKTKNFSIKGKGKGKESPRGHKANAP